MPLDANETDPASIEQTYRDYMKLQKQWQGSDYRNPLHFAAMNGETHLDLLSALIHSLSNPFEQDYMGANPIFWAASTGHPETLYVLYCMGRREKSLLFTPSKEEKEKRLLFAPSKEEEKEKAEEDKEKAEKEKDYMITELALLPIEEAAQGGHVEAMVLLAYLMLEHCESDEAKANLDEVLKKCHEYLEHKIRRVYQHSEIRLMLTTQTLSLIRASRLNPTFALLAWLPDMDALLEKHEAYQPAGFIASAFSSISTRIAASMPVLFSGADTGQGKDKGEDKPQGKDKGEDKPQGKDKGEDKPQGATPSTCHYSTIEYFERHCKP